jgi:hypothetical protein
MRAEHQNYRYCDIRRCSVCPDSIYKCRERLEQIGCYEGKTRELPPGARWGDAEGGNYIEQSWSYLVCAQAHLKNATARGVTLNHRQVG